MLWRKPPGVHIDQIYSKCRKPEVRVGVIYYEGNLLEYILIKSIQKCRKPEVRVGVICYGGNLLEYVLIKSIQNAGNLKYVLV